MKTKMIIGSVLSMLSITAVFAQDKTTVSAYNAEISDNLDLRAVASIFGDSKDLADFERRLNDPEIQISNLDLNNDKTLKRRKIKGVQPVARRGGHAQGTVSVGFGTDQ